MFYILVGSASNSIRLSLLILRPRFYNFLSELSFLSKLLSMN